MSSYTQADLAAIKSAKARGVRKATLNGESVEFASLQEMNAIIADIEAELGLRAGNARSLYPKFVERP